MPGGSARGRYMHGLNCRNVGGSHTPGNHTAESTLPGWGDRTRTRKCRFKNRYLKYRPNSLVFWNIFGPETFRGRREETAMRLGIQTRQLTKPYAENGRRTAGLPRRSFNYLQQFHISGRFRTSAPGAYLPAVSNSGTPAHRRTSRGVLRTD
jgi:hypothetical protein